MPSTSRGLLQIPFDPRGRAGRVLNLLMLVDQGLLNLPVLYLSRYILRNRADYYRSLLAVTARNLPAFR
jgi:Fic family protein